MEAMNATHSALEKNVDFVDEIQRQIITVNYK